MSLSNLLIIFSSSFMALFPVINPLGNGFVVNGFFTDLDPQQRKAAIQKLTLNFIMIGVGTLVIGHLFLLIFGLAIPVIQLGGGILICKTAMELLGDSGSSDKEEASKNVDGFRWKNPSSPCVKNTPRRNRVKDLACESQSFQFCSSYRKGYLPYFPQVSLFFIS